MNNLIKSVLIGAAIAAAVTAAVSALTGLAGEPEYSIVRGIRAERAAVTANPLCAPMPIKMPCLQSGASQSRASS